MLTPWSYEIDQDELPPLLALEDFEAMTGRPCEDDSRVSSLIAAASATVRNLCGWHVGPVMRCKARVSADGSTVAALPAMRVYSVESVRDGGEDVRFEWVPGGLVRRADRLPFCDRWQGVEVAYTAGVCDDSVRSLVCHMVEQAMAATPGVTSETADGVSISFSQSDGQVGGFPVTSRMRAVLKPFTITWRA